MYWLEISVATDGEGAEAVAEALRPYAYNNGVALEQLGDWVDPSPDALESVVTVKIYVPEDHDTPDLRRRLEEALYHLGRLYPIPAPVYRQLEEEDWANAWKAHYHPFRVGNGIWIRPTWLASDEQNEGIGPDDVVLVLDPGMAFGTGLHPSTQMCLQALEQWVKPGMRVLDVGTGSGILAIAAARLGATLALAIDTDDIAVKTAVANAAQNGVDDRVSVRQGTLDTVSEEGWQVVVVNILAPVILSLLQRDRLLDYVTLDGRLILSGIIDQQAADVQAAVTEAGGRIVETYTIRDWVTLVIGRAAN